MNGSFNEEEGGEWGDVQVSMWSVVFIFDLNRFRVL